MTDDVEFIDPRAVAARGDLVWAASSFAGDVDKIIRSTDGGITWETVHEVDAFGEQNKSLAIDPTDNNVIYSGDYKTDPFDPADTAICGNRPVACSNARMASASPPPLAARYVDVWLML